MIGMIGTGALLDWFLTAHTRTAIFSVVSSTASAKQSFHRGMILSSWYYPSSLTYHCSCTTPSASYVTFAAAISASSGRCVVGLSLRLVDPLSVWEVSREFRLAVALPATSTVCSEFHYVYPYLFSYYIVAVANMMAG